MKTNLLKRKTKFAIRTNSVINEGTANFLNLQYSYVIDRIIFENNFVSHPTKLTIHKKKKKQKLADILMVSRWTPLHKKIFDGGLIGHAACTCIYYNIMLHSALQSTDCIS